eukprot:8784353-Pyramimonas_sp.AAC.1
MSGYCSELLPAKIALACSAFAAATKRSDNVASIKQLGLDALGRRVPGRACDLLRWHAGCH